MYRLSILEQFSRSSGHLLRTGQLLWDVHRKDGQGTWRPKSEAAFGAWLAEQLRLSLARGGVVISREVCVREMTTQHGLTVDIQADVPVTGGRPDQSAPAASSSREAGTRT